MVKKMKRIGVAQSLMTLANAACGFLAISVLLQSSAAGGGVIAPEGFRLAAALILLGLFFDTLDGKIARLTNHESEFGAQLDSLADVITFGFAPAILAKAWIDQTSTLSAFQHGDIPLGLLLCMLFTICAILRLARFTAELDGEGSGGGHAFFGLPTPAAAGTIAACALVYFDSDRSQPQAIAAALPYVLPILSLLMVSRIPYAHVGSLLLRGRKPFTHLLRIVFFGILAAFVFSESVFAGFSIYLASGPLRVVRDRVLQRDRVEEEGLF